MNSEWFQLVNRAFAIWGLTFAALMTYWQLAENTQPGQQYADPLLPCTYVAMLVTGPLLQATVLVETIRRTRKSGWRR